MSGELHGCEGAAISVTALGAFRAAVARAVWSKKLAMTNTPALFKPVGWSLRIPPSSSSGVAFGSFDGIWRIGPMRRDAFFRLLDYASTGSLGHGPIHLLVESAQEIGLYWDSEQAGWTRPGLPPLHMMTGPIQHFRGAIWQAWQEKVAAALCTRKGFRGGLCSDIYGSRQLLVSFHLRERDKILLRAILWRSLEQFLLSKAKKEDIRCRFCNPPDNDGHLFWDCTFPRFVELRNSPHISFLDAKGPH